MTPLRKKEQNAPLLGDVEVEVLWSSPGFLQVCGGMEESECDSGSGNGGLRALGSDLRGAVCCDDVGVHTAVLKSKNIYIYYKRYVYNKHGGS